MAHYDFYTVRQPQIEQAGRALLESPTAKVDTVERRHVTVDDETLVAFPSPNIVTPQVTLTSPTLKVMASACWLSSTHPCKLTDPGNYAIGVERKVPDGSAILAGFLLAAVAGFATAHVTCFTSWCDDTGKAAFIAADVGLGVLGVVGVLGFFLAVERGLNN
jgi:hypothetical protein